MITATVVLSFLGFVALGLPDGLLGVAWPSLRSEFSQPIGAIAFLLADGTFLIAAGLALVSVTPWWWALVPGFALVGIGDGLVDTGFNVYAAHHYSATTMNWMHACYGLGATTGPPIRLIRDHLF